MIHVTRWRPDTCECVLCYKWDDTLPKENCILGVEVIEQVCQHHKGVANLYDKVLEENQRKNYLMGLLLDNAFKLRDGEPGNYKFKEGVDIQWAYTVDRKLQVQITGVNLTGQEKAALQTAANNRFGNGKVEIK